MIGVYGMTKAAVIQLTRTVAVELGPAGVRCNAVAPGWVETGMTAAAWTGPDGVVDEAQRAQVHGSRQGGSPLGLAGEPADIAYAMLYLASDAARFVTGTVLAPTVACTWRERERAGYPGEERTPDGGGVSVSEPGTPARSERPMVEA